jgi:cytochrome b subunit of formate dehydrogenase
LSYIAHPDYRDRKNEPVLYWTFVFMEILLGGTFLFFWTHTFLWWRKTYWVKHFQEKEGAPAGHAADPDGNVQILRFRPRERIMHVILILSFFTLILTGFPVKYPAMPWSRFLLGMWGGAEVAGFFHRLAAFILIVLVTIVAIQGLMFLFPKGQGRKGFLGRLLGPESLVPNLKDLRDIRDMFLWFFDRGPMPKFERWTYWEKFDFWAVFWGMFAIGVSGLLLWKSEWSSWIVPGWVLNVATLVHSEEALLAALFIFTVHFFNTHFIPTKFPMDRLIFTGTYSLEELKEQRPLEYERLMAEGRIESLKKKHPGVATKLFAAIFGLGSLLLGMLLTALIVWAILAP